MGTAIDAYNKRLQDAERKKLESENTYAGAVKDRLSGLADSAKGWVTSRAKEVVQPKGEPVELKAKGGRITGFKGYGKAKKV